MTPRNDHRRNSFSSERNTKTVDGLADTWTKWETHIISITMCYTPKKLSFSPFRRIIFFVGHHQRRPLLLRITSDALDVVSIECSLTLLLLLQFWCRIPIEFFSYSLFFSFRFENLSSFCDLLSDGRQTTNTPHRTPPPRKETNEIIAYKNRRPTQKPKWIGAATLYPSPTITMNHTVAAANEMMCRQDRKVPNRSQMEMGSSENGPSSLYDRNVVLHESNRNGPIDDDDDDDPNETIRYQLKSHNSTYYNHLSSIVVWNEIDIAVAVAAAAAAAVGEKTKSRVCQCHCCAPNQIRKFMWIFFVCVS